MQCTADFHHHIAHPLFPHPDGLFEHPAAFDTAIDMFDTYPSPRNLPVVRFLFGRQLLPARLLRGLDDLHALQRERLKAHVLQQLASGQQRIRGRVGHALVVDASRLGLTQEQDAHRSVDQQEVFQHMPLFLPAIARFLFRRIVGARDGSFGAVMTKRGATVGMVVGTVSDGADATSSGASSPSRCWRKVSTLRHGASPKVRKAFRKTGSKT
jgi:hypothetical protein